MGLDTTHDCWHGAYSSFNTWRKAIARAAGLGDLEDYEGFGGSKVWPFTPLAILLSHSDCDGHIDATECGPLADALEALLPELDKLDPLDRGYPSHADDARRFIRGLRAAAAAGENVEFQ